MVRAVLATRLAACAAALAGASECGYPGASECTHKDDIQLLQVTRSSMRGGVAASTDPLDVAREAYAKGGLWVSMVDASGPIAADLSASILHKDLPTSVYISGSANDGRGTVFAPRSAPSASCGYPVDANTRSRIDKTSGEKDRCGVWDSQSAKGKWVNMSGRCHFAPEDYAQQYDFKPLESVRDGNSWQIQRGTCHFDTPEQALEAQQHFWQNLAGTSESRWSSVSGGPIAYNEIVLQTSSRKSVQPLGYVWAHTGPARSPESSDTQACCIAQEFCRTDEDVTIFEIANLAEGFGGRLSFEDLTGYQKALSNGGHDPADIVGKLDLSVFCALECSNNCGL